MIFAREVSANLTSLVKKLDKAAADSKGKMGTFAVFCNNDEKLEEQLKELAKKEKLTNLVLSIDDRKAGPYDNFPAEADVTVMLYVNRKVKVNHSFRKGELKEEQVDKVIGMKDRLPHLEFLIYKDARGLRHYQHYNLVSLDDVQDRAVPLMRLVPTFSWMRLLRDAVATSQ